VIELRRIFEIRKGAPIGVGPSQREPNREFESLPHDKGRNEKKGGVVGAGAPTGQKS